MQTSRGPLPLSSYQSLVPSYDEKNGTSARSGEVDGTRRRRTDRGRDVVEYVRGYGAVDRQRHQRIASLRGAADLRAGDVDAGSAKSRTHAPDDTGLVGVAEEQQVVRGEQVDVEAVDLGELLDLPRAAERA